MLKKIIPVILSLTFLFNICAAAQVESPDAVTAPTESVQDFSAGAPENTAPQTDTQTSGASQGTRPGRGNMQGFGGQMQLGNGQMPSADGQMPSSDGQMPSFGGQMPSFDGQMPSADGQRPSFGGNGGMNRFPGNMQGSNQNTQAETEAGFMSFVKTNFTPILSVILLFFAFIFVILYKRKKF